jgi:rubrerythrin
MIDEDLLREAEALIGPVRGPGTDLVPAGAIHPARREAARAALTSPKMQEILGSMADYVRCGIEDGQALRCGLCGKARHSGEACPVCGSTDREVVEALDIAERDWVA